MTRKDVPNLLTYLRLVLAVATLCGLLSGAYLAALLGETGRAAALVFASLAAFVVAALTDFFDGWLARRWDAGSAWGATLDPIADKLAATAAVLGLLVLLPRPAIAVVGAMILFREVLVSGLREGGAARGLRLPVTLLAKWKTTLQLAALSLEMAAAGLRLLALSWGAAWPWLPAFDGVADAVLWIAGALTVITGAQYASAARRALAG
ncbi:MAG: CDP-alcohol phosphatidyltransferase family protein [Caulobacteraceae bacterium]|nr:CDP-alcohol phosphatidyltransferase family protein [Caulobacter sp.]